MATAECKLCSKKFSNGKALGGHMRTHYATLPLPPKTPQRQEEHSEPPPPTESTSSDERESSTSEKLPLSLSLSYGLRENPKKSFRLVDPESTRAGCKRAKVVTTTTKTEFSMEEDVALCLVMLSKDVWTSFSTESTTSREKVYKCEMCDRVFKSTQGLGSHRASHNKQKRNAISSDDEGGVCENGFRKPEIVLVHQCSFCDRIFSSHQALGGHKRSHYTVSKDKFQEAPATIDLNLPAAMEDDDEDGEYFVVLSDRAEGVLGFCG